MAKITPAVLRSRSIRELILKIGYNTHQAAPGVAVLARHVYAAFSTGRVQYEKAEIDVEISDLIDDGLLAVEDLPGVGVGPAEKGYQATSKGRDFYRAGYPWGRIDEFTGDGQIA